MSRRGPLSNVALVILVVAGGARALAQEHSHHSHAADLPVPDAGIAPAAAAVSEGAADAGAVTLSPDAGPAGDEHEGMSMHSHAASMDGAGAGHHMGGMQEPLALSMSREGSGTAWQPDSTPIHGHHFAAGNWTLMLHYNVFAGFNAQSGPRGAQELMSTNWVMFMAEHALAGGAFSARVMLSAEPFTTAVRGVTPCCFSPERPRAERLCMTGSIPTTSSWSSP